MNDHETQLMDEARAGRLSRRELLRWAGVWGLSGPAVATLLAACGSSGDSAKTGSGATSAPRQGGALRVAVETPGQGIDPVTMYEAGAIVTAQQVAEYLAWADDRLSLRPVLAQSWQVGPSPKTWTFQLRPGVQFHDGRPLRAADVAATFDRLTDPQSNSGALSTFQGVLSKGNTEARGDSTVVFHLDRPLADFPYYVCQLNYNALILPADYQIGDFQKKPVGTGPFLLNNYTPQVSATYTRNPHYWQSGLPYLNSLTVRYFASNSSEVLALQSGEIDLMAETPYQGSQELFSSPDISTVFLPSTSYRELHMKVNAKPWSDPRVRQALALCLDRQGLLNLLFGGKGQLGNDTGFAPLFPETAPIPQRTQDYATARKLLAQAGYPRGFSATLTSENYLEVPDYLQAVQQMAKPAGIDINLSLMTPQAYGGSGNNQPWLQVPFGCVDWASRPTPGQLIGPAYTCEGIWNSSGWCDPAYTKLLASLQAELDLQRRRQIATQMQQLQQQATPAIIAYWIAEPRAQRANVAGVALADTGGLDVSRAYLTS